MGEVFIGAMQKIVGIIAVLMVLLVIVAFFSSLAGGTSANVNGQSVGVIGSFIFLCVGLAWVIISFGMIYTFLGIYENMKKTAQLLESQARLNRKPI